MILLIVLMGVGPLMPWRRGTGLHLVRLFWPPVAFGVLVALAIGLWKGFDQPKALAAFGASAFVAASISLEIGKGTLARRQATGENPIAALANLISRNNRRYGGYVVHLGIVMVAIAVTASTNSQVERAAKLKPGESVEVGEYRLTYNGLRDRDEPGVRILEAQLAVEEGNELLGTLVTDKKFFRGFERQPATSVGIRTSVADDLYVVLAGWEDDGSASLMVFVNPMVIWLWMGGIVAVAGGLIALWPETRARVVTVGARTPGLAHGRA
jgi:cytochrome c-type biogenesis protein CcmF